MGFKTKEVYNGFKLISEKELKEIKSMGRIFEHEKSGARLLSLYNDDDDNKVFSIAFRTPPEDNTGLPHILEHSVLNGSRKFPVKAPFVELLKGSLNTFLNALTSPDKTRYPVASRNNKDFMNLMDVYLDAVFYPNIYDRKEILMQEGWHYHLEKPEDKLTYKGVVYNEMKGAFSSPEGTLYRKIWGTALKDTIYANCSGGDPKNIPELTREQFLDFHRKYYHPSNSYIMLYGNGDIEEQLKFINDEYLNNFDKIEVDSEIHEQDPYKEIYEVIEEYPISKDDTEEDKAYVSLNYVIGNYLNRKDILGMEILAHMLLETSGAPLKKALIDGKLGKDVDGMCLTSFIQPIFSIIVKNSNIDKIEAFKEIVNDTLSKLVSEGIDRELIEASVNVKEFELREGSSGGATKGTRYANLCMETWLYGGSPYEALQYEENLNSIKEEIKDNYFERLIEKYILNNTHGSIFALKPKKGLADENAEKLQKELDEYKSSLTKKEIDKIVEDTNRLMKIQATPDKPEDLEKIPMVDIEDISKEPEVIPQEERELSDTKVLYHEVFTSGIMYTNLLFDASIIEQELVPYVSLLGQLLGKVDTTNKAYSKLSNSINAHTGGIRYSFETYSDLENNDLLNPKFRIKTKALANKYHNLVELLNEIIHESKFHDENRIKEILSEIKSRLEMEIMQNGSVITSNRVMSYFSKKYKYEESINGIDFYKFICNLIKNYDELKEELILNLNKAYKKIFNANNLIISLTCEKEYYGLFEVGMRNLVRGLSTEVHEEQNYSFEEKKLNEGLKTPGQVQYVAKGYNFKKLGVEYSGKLQVLNTIASFDYLWNRIRVKGGAYGCMTFLNKSGEFVFASFRDPNLKETLDAYDKMAEYFRNLEISDRDMKKYIIGAIRDLSRPLTPAQKGERATECYIKNISYEDLKKEREEVLSTNQGDIKELSSVFEKLMNENYLCVLGNENKIEECKDEFNELINLL